MQKFYLGTHEAHWLYNSNIPLFVSLRRIRCKTRFKPANTSWALDSGGFTELNMYGGWSMDYKTFGDRVRIISDGIGNMDFASIQDWMCEPFVLKKTGKTVKEHQALTVQNYLDLQSSFPDIPWLPVIQGYAEYEYFDCIDLYMKYGVDLKKAKTVGLGSVCRRQSTNEIDNIVRNLASNDIKCHGFGVKILGLKKFSDALFSADSLAWSLAARLRPPQLDCAHKCCSNCRKWAEIWYQKIIKLTN